MSSLYLDHAAATPLDPSVQAAMAPYQTQAYANPSSIYRSAQSTRLAIDDARAVVADLLAARATELVWTSGGTESNNMAVQGVLRAHPGSHWVTSSIEHDAILAQIEPLSREGYPATVVPVESNGIVDVASIERAITDKTVLVSVMLANNEIGTIQPLTEISRLLTTIRADRRRRQLELPIYLHTDAVQAGNYLSLHTGRLGVDLMSLSGSKIYGPKGSGALYIRTGTTIQPLLFGGGQERGRRSGTENVAGIIGLSRALVMVQADRTSEGRWLAELRDDVFDRLRRLLPGLLVNGDATRRLPNNINITIPGVEGEGLVLYLDQAGIQVSTGSACSSGDLDPSHVLLALRRTVDEANSSLRITLGRGTDAAAIDRLVEVLPPIVARLRQLGSS